MSFRLVVLSGADKGKTIRMEPGSTQLIGRGEAATIRLADPAVSRVHFELNVSDAGLFVTDKGSSSGTYINGSKVETMEIKSGAQIQVGDTVMRLESEIETGQTTMAAPVPTAALPLPKLVGQKLGKFTLNEIIGVGNSGMIFKASEEGSDRVAAVKVLSPQFTSTDEERQRFVRAMKTMLPIKDDHIVNLYNAGKTGPYCWAAMEHVDGENLAELIERIGIEGMLDWTKVWRVAVDIAMALKTGFEHQVIHRNVTPRNILRRKSDEACLLGDFMLAKALQGTLAQQVTQPGQILGEISYLAPERTRADAEVDTRSDMYGLGATCYALLTGRAPAGGDSMPEIIKNVREIEPEKPKTFQLAVNEMFQDVVMKMIAKDPAQRYQTPLELLKELLRIGKFNNLNAGV
jgi:serine/threonine protein kinase